MNKREDIICLDTVVLVAQALPALTIGTLYAVGLIVADKSWRAIKKKAGDKQ